MNFPQARAITQELEIEYKRAPKTKNKRIPRSKSIAITIHLKPGLNHLEYGIQQCSMYTGVFHMHDVIPTVVPIQNATTINHTTWSFSIGPYSFFNIIKYHGVTSIQERAVIYAYATRIRLYHTYKWENPPSIVKLISKYTSPS